MATSSITKEYVIEDDETCERLIALLNEPAPEYVADTNYYEEGKKKLIQYFGH